jgi:hypothetical protein
MDMFRAAYCIYFVSVAGVAEIRAFCPQVFCIIGSMGIMTGDTSADCCRAVHIFLTHEILIMAIKAEVATPGKELELVR